MDSKRKRYKQYLEPNKTGGSLPVSRQTLWRWNKNKTIANVNVVTNNKETKYSDRGYNSAEDIVDNISNYDSDSNISVNLSKNNSPKNDSDTSNSSSNGSTKDSSSNSTFLSNTSSNGSFTVQDHVQDEAVTGSKNSKEADDLDEYMFKDAKLTKKDVLTMVYCLTLRHNLSNEARTDIFSLLKLCANMHENDSLSTTNYMISKYFDPPDDDIHYIFTCVHCHSKIAGPISKRQFKRQNVKCQRCNTERVISLVDHNYFILIDIRKQLKSILSEKKIYDGLQLSAYEDGANTIRDIGNSEIYRNLKKEVNFELSYNFSTDGAPIFTSSRLSMWPIQLIINEIPPQYRFRRLLFAGIWVGKGEPKATFMNTFLKPFVDQAKTLLQSGVNIVDPHTGEQKLFKLLPLFCCVDTVARPIIQNRVQFNGYFGCSWCYHPGVNVNGQVKYPEIKDQNIHLRTLKSHLEDLNAVAANEYKKKVNGVKGPSILLLCPMFDIVWSLPPDYMHGVILGVVKQLWDLWTTYDVTSRLTYYIGKPAAIKKVNDRLLSIKPPQDIHRVPRPLNERAKWKASEWKSWLLFYSIPCLDEILPKQYLSHFALLVDSIFVLLQEEISRLQLNHAEINLKEFVHKAETIYGQGVMTFNMHSLLHLCESVRKTGPLWATSTFPFESGIYRIKQQVTGPVGVIKQISKKIYQANTIFTDLSNTDKNYSEKCISFCASLYSSSPAFYRQNPNDMKFLGQQFLISPEEHKNFSRLCVNYKSDHSFSFRRCNWKGMTLHSVEYTRPTKTCDYVVQLNTEEFFKIVKIIKCSAECYLYGQKFLTQTLKCGKSNLSHINIAYDLSHYYLISIEAVKCKCVFIQLGEKKYLCKFPNNFEVQ